MSRYYCPFCSSRNKFHITRCDGILICGHCYDPLIKKNLISSRRIFGIITATAFLVPLIIMITIIIKDFINEKETNFSETVLVLITSK